MDAGIWICLVVILYTLWVWAARVRAEDEATT